MTPIVTDHAAARGFPAGEARVFIFWKTDADGCGSRGSATARLLAAGALGEPTGFSLPVSFFTVGFAAFSIKSFIQHSVGLCDRGRVDGNSSEVA